MTAAINPHLAATFAPPVMEARRWVAETPLPAGLPLINLSQAAPVDPPPAPLREAMADALLHRAEAHLYGPVLGDGELRAQIAADWSALYGGAVAPEQVAVTAGCNQAFCTAVMTLCAPGDAVVLPVPWYFNHMMWLDMSGVEAIAVPCGEGMLPDPAALAAAVTPRTRAIALVSPNNPAGVAYPDALLGEVYDICRAAGLALILDETYRDYHPGEGAPHTLFTRPGWEEVLVHLYSFSKVFRLTGHRTGAIVTGADRLAQAEKMLDTVTICPPRTGQIGALFGLRQMRQWVAGERAEILDRRARLEALFAAHLSGWRIRGAGAYFAWVEPPFDGSSEEIARALLADQAILTLPGSMFLPADAPDRPAALRIAFANADAAGLAETVRRLAAFHP